MRRTTTELNRQMLDRADSYATADITFVDGTKRSLGKDDFFQDNTVVESAETSSFPLGVVIPKSVTLSLVNDDDRWRKYAFDGAKVHVWTNFIVDDGTIKQYDLGTYTVIKPESYGTTVTLSAVDDCYKLDKPYTSSLVFPVTAAIAAKDAADTCGITLDTNDFKNNGYLIKQKPEGVTFRTFFGDVAMLAGGIAKFDAANHLVIIGYSLDIFGDGNLNGGVFDGVKPYDSGDAADGGSFNPWNKGYQFDAGTAANLSKIHALHDWQDLAIEADDVVITGVRLVGQDDKQYSNVVSESYVLDVTSSIAAGNEQTLVDKIAAEVVGFRFRPFSGNYISYPLAEAMDLANVIDRAGNVYQTVLTDVTYSFSGSTVMKCAADPPIRNSSAYSSSEARAVVKARAQMQSDMQQVISPIEAATLSLSNLISQGLGLYVTEKKNDDGSRIYYLHDEKTVAASKNLWRISGNVFSVSSDGGKTWRAGIDSNGNVLANVLSVVGLNFSWAHGGILTLGGVNDGNGQLKVLDSSNRLIGQWNSSGASMRGKFISYNNKRATVMKTGSQLFYGSDDNLAYINWENPSYNFDPIVADGRICSVKDEDGRKGLAITTHGGTIVLGVTQEDGSTLAMIRANFYGGSAIDRKYLLYASSRIGTRGGIAIRKPAWGGAYNGEWPGVNTDYAPGIQWLNANGTVNRAIALRSLEATVELEVSSGLRVSGNLIATGTKNRAVETKHYGTVGMNAFETAGTYFADIGSGIIGNEGTVLIDFDPVFCETVELDSEYQVLTTQTSKGQIDWVEKNNASFVVHGNAGTTFDWMLIVPQKDYVMNRMETLESEQISDGTDILNAFTFEDQSEKDVIDMVNNYEGGLETV